MDFFNPDERYFYIDSANFREAKTKLYGFAVTREGFVGEDNRLLADMSALDGCGVYVYVERTEREVVVRQDFNASYGIFLFREGGFFALSNSFQYLVDHIRAEHRLTLDRDYANHMICMDLASLSHDRTMMNEIKLLHRNVTVHIDLDGAGLSLEELDYEEDRYELSSPEGMAILDSWYDRWTHLFRCIQKETDNLTVVLSGGFDSRISFLLALTSGIDMSRVNVYSIHDELHTHAEDYAIASEIAEHFGFRLNEDFCGGSTINYSVRDTLNICLYGKLSFHNEMYFKTDYGTEKRFVVPGSGGESLRDHWNESPYKFYLNYTGRSAPYRLRVSRELRTSLKKVMGESYDYIQKKYSITDRRSKYITLNMHRDVRCRSHFGTAQVDDFHANVMNLAPLLDPVLRKLKLTDAECGDKNLLFTLIEARYCPDLLEFRYEGGRSIRQETKDYAGKLSARFPREEKREDGAILPFTLQSLRKTERDDNPRQSAGEPETAVMELMECAAFRQLFVSSYDPEIYDYARLWTGKTSYHPLRKCYTVLAIGKAILDCKESGRSRNTVEDAYTELRSLSESQKDEILPEPVVQRHLFTKGLVLVPKIAARVLKL